MKGISGVMLLAAVLVSLAGCTEDAPRVRVLNLRPTTVDVQLKPRSGSTININDVGPRSATGYVDIPATAYEVDAKVENVSASATTFFTADMDQTYTVVVLDGDPPTVRVDRP